MVKQRVAGILSICVLFAIVSCVNPKPQPVITTMKVSEMGLESHSVKVGEVLKWVADSPNISSFTIHVTGLNICKDQPE